MLDIGQKLDRSWDTHIVNQHRHICIRPRWRSEAPWWPGLDNHPHLERLPDELRDLAVVGVLVAADDEVEDARGVAEDGGRVRLRHAHQRLAVNLDDLQDDGVKSMKKPHSRL